MFCYSYVSSFITFHTPRQGKHCIRSEFKLLRFHQITFRVPWVSKMVSRSWSVCPSVCNKVIATTNDGIDPKIVT